MDGNCLWLPAKEPLSPQAIQDPYLILVGLGFAPNRISGDKNFWYYLIPHLLETGVGRITIISIDPSSQLNRINVNHFLVQGHVVTLRRLPTRLLHWDSNKDNRGGAFPLGVSALEKMISLATLFREIQGSHDAKGVPRIHLMDNFGPINPTLASLLSGSLSVSAIAKNGRRNQHIQKLHSQISFMHPRLQVVAYSKAYSDQLHEWGVKQVHFIPWGVHTATPLPTLASKAAAKSALGLAPNLPLYVWAGYIQQIDEADFKMAVTKAREALDQGLKAVFFFAFKPESYQDKLSKFHDPSRGIIVRRTSIGEFLQLRLAADLLYSPFQHKTHIIGPPLTWIEFMAAGVPIVTTSVGGVEEIVLHGKTGFVAPDPNALSATMLAIGDRYQAMGTKCFESIRHQRDIKDIARQYMSLWFGRR